MSKVRCAILASALVVGGLFGVWWSHISNPSGGSDDGSQANDLRNRRLISSASRSRADTIRDRNSKGDPAARHAGAIENQRLLIFKDAEALNQFLENSGELEVLGHIPSLNSVWVSFSDFRSLNGALGDEADEGFVYPVTVPTLGEGQIQDGAVPLGANLLQWLGVDRDHRAWGSGVKVAVLDTGVQGSQFIGNLVRSIDLVTTSPDLATFQNGHGTAVASAISGKSPVAPGVAPAVDLISVRVADGAGRSNTFQLAKGIVDAADAGARLINVSMGGPGDSPVLRQAVDYAMERGALVIASSGNNGIQEVQYPAAIEGVIAVGAVDAMGEHLDFSNTGDQVDVTAPGHGVRAAWIDDQFVEASGTSFSAPIVTGALAAIMSHGSQNPLSPVDAWHLMQQHLNDAGKAGSDPLYGAGMPDLGRLLNRNVPGRHDAAIASLSPIAPDAQHPGGQIEILVQNRGTENLLNATLLVGDGDRQHRITLTQLPPGEVQAIRVPIGPLDDAGTPQLFDARLWLGQGVSDIHPENNQRQWLIAPDE